MKIKKIYKWRPLGRRFRFLKRPFSKKISKDFIFMRRKLVKNFRFQHWLRKHYLPQTLKMPYLPPHKEFSIYRHLQRLDSVLYEARIVRSPVQARHYIIKGYIKVDGQTIWKPSFLVPRGSVITFDITKVSNLHISNINRSKPYIYLGRPKGMEQIIFPKYFKMKKEDLRWAVNLFNKR